MGAWLREIKKAEREAIRAQKAAEREHRALVRQAERALKEEERVQKQLAKAAAAERKQLEREAKEAHVASMLAHVDSLNAGLQNSQDELDNILQSTLEVDDFVDLPLMRMNAEQAPFNRPDLEEPVPPPTEIEYPPRPRGIMPRPPSGLSALFGKGKYDRQVAAAKQKLKDALYDWQHDCDSIESRREQLYIDWRSQEDKRLHDLDIERSRHREQNREIIGQIDQLITGLEQGNAQSVEEYIGLVLDNSIYPEEFPVTREFTFSGELAELALKVYVPGPDSAPSVKGYKYTKASDEIKPTALSAKAIREGYASAVNQVAIRSLHEIFEADRREIIQTIDLKVGTETIDPATGRHNLFTFVAVGAHRASFLELDLEKIAPEATLEHMGAAVSPNPHGLKHAKASGVRRSALQQQQTADTAGAPAPQQSQASQVQSGKVDYEAGQPTDSSPAAASDATQRAIIENLKSENVRLMEILADPSGEEELAVLSDEQVLQSVGIYRYHHPLENALDYKKRLVEINTAKSDMVKAGVAIESSEHFMYDNSLAKGKKMCKDLSTLMLLAYNSQADSCVKSLRAGNVLTAKKRVNNTKDKIAKLGAMMEMHISKGYHALQIDELELTADYLVKKQEEKEAAREERERLREEKRAEAELAAEREKLEKERTHLINALETLEQTGNSDEALQEKLREIENAIETNDYRIANVRAGYVYVISNKGAFGDGIIKIGLTRRLDPMDRVIELGDASVPFRFDVHCLYFSEDAVQLENELHQHFSHRRLNHANVRKEFFFATPQEVKDVLVSKVGNLLEYNDHIESTEYFQSVGNWPEPAKPTT